MENSSCPGFTIVCGFESQNTLFDMTGSATIWTPWTLAVFALPFIIIFLIFYYVWIKPFQLLLDLSDIGFSHLWDGTQPCVESKKRGKLELIRINQRRREIGNLPPVYPNGWFNILESDKLSSGEVRHVVALGENFAVFRTEKGQVHILDAYCPHLGANMAIGGSVHGDCIECPFHKWRFSGPTGSCTSVPYSTGSIPNAKVKRWPTREANGFIFVWYHAENEEPYYDIDQCPEITVDGLTFHGRTETLVACHIQDVQENGADVGHLNALHGPNVMAGVDVRYFEREAFKFLRHVWDAKWEASTEEKHVGILNLTSRATLFGKINLVEISAFVRQIGPGYVELRINAPWGLVLLLMNVTPVEPLLQRVVQRMYCNTAFSPLSKLMLYVETLMFERDVMVWNHKRYENKPHLVKEDRGIVRHRRWYNQFYSENSPKFTFRKDNMEW